MNPLPLWLAAWWRSFDAGTSSRTIAAACSCSTHLLQTIDLDSPRDTSDVGRCIRLLDLAAANGQDWRAQLGDVARDCPAWGVLVPAWSEIEAAYHGDVAAQNAWRKALYVAPGGRRRLSPRKDIPRPPSRCWWMVSTLRGHGDPYRYVMPHPFGSTT